MFSTCLELVRWKTVFGPDTDGHNHHQPRKSIPDLLHRDTHWIFHPCKIDSGRLGASWREWRPRFRLVWTRCVRNLYLGQILMAAITKNRNRHLCLGLFCTFYYLTMQTMQTRPSRHGWLVSRLNLLFSTRSKKFDWKTSYSRYWWTQSEQTMATEPRSSLHALTFDIANHGIFTLGLL